MERCEESINRLGEEHGETEVGRGGRTTKRHMDRVYVDKLRELINCNPSLKPADGCRILRELFCVRRGMEPRGFPNDSAIKTKVSNLKRKR